LGKVVDLAISHFFFCSLPGAEKNQSPRRMYVVGDSLLLHEQTNIDQ